MKNPCLSLLCLTCFVLIIECSIFGTLTVTPSTVMANGVYYFIVDTTTIIPSGGYITITFPSSISLSSTASCSYQFGLGTTPTCVATGNTIKISGTGVFPNQNGIQIRVNYAVNPNSAQNITSFTMKFFNSANTQLDSTSTAFSFQFTPDTLTAVALNPSSFIVGATTTWTVSITPKNAIPIGGIVKISIPKWNQAAYGATNPLSMLTSGSNTCSPITGLSSGSITCSFVIDPTASNSDTLTITNAFTVQQNQYVTFQISIANAHNAPTTRPYTFNVYTMDSGGYSIDSGSATMTMTIPNTLTTVAVSVTVDAPTTVDTDTTYLFQVQVNNPIPVGGQIKVLIPSEVGVGSLTTVVSEQRLNSGATISTIGGNSRYILISNGYTSTSDYVPINGLVAFRLKYLTNPSTTSTSTSFQVETYDSTYIIEQITIGLTVVATQGTILMNSISYSDLKVLEYDGITLDFTLPSALTSGSYIQVTIPTEFTVSNVLSSSCSLTNVVNLVAGYTCSISGNILTINKPFGSTTSSVNQTVKFTIPSAYIRNPTSTRPTTTGIKVKSYSQNGIQIDSYSGNSFSATVNSLSSASVTPSSYVTGQQPVTYTFSIKTPYEVEKNAQIVIKLPDEIIVYNTNTASKCTSVSTISSSLTCKTSTSQIKVQSGFSSGLCTCSGTIQFSVPGMKNPRSTATSSTFEIYVNTYDNYQIYQLKTGVTTTMTTPTTLTNVTITQTQSINGELDSYLFSVKNNNEKLDGDYMFINAPSEIQFTKNTTCAARTNIKGFYYCTYMSAQQIKVSFSFTKRRMLLQAGDGFSFLLMNIQNPTSFKPTSSFTFSTYTKSGNAISSITTGGPTVTDNTAGNFSQLIISPSNYAGGEQTNLTFQILPKNYEQGMSMQLYLPSDVSLYQSKITICESLSTITVSSQLVCEYNNSTRSIKLFNAINVLSNTQYAQLSTQSKTFQIKIGNFINPNNKNVSNSFTINSFDSLSYTMDSKNVSIYYTCSSLCAQCDKNDYSKCISCSSPLLLYQGTCVSSCPDGTNSSNGVCQACSSACSSCSATGDSCASCQESYYFYDNQCVNSCPQGYYISNGNCQKDNQINYIQYFRKYEFQCFLFIFSWIAIAFTIINFAIVFIYGTNNKSKDDYKITKVNKDTNKNLQIDNVNSKINSKLRFIELTIPMIAFVELFSWIFILISFLQVNDIIPFILICAVVLLNFILNCFMFFKVKKDKNELQDNDNFIKFLIILVSFKLFYWYKIRYSQKSVQNNQRCYNYDYIDKTIRIIFICGLVLVNLLVIISCILNIRQQDEKKALFCLDIDVIFVSFYQVILIIITLINCSRNSSKTLNKIQDDSNFITKGKDKSPTRRQKKQTSVYMKSANDDTDEEQDTNRDKSHSKFKSNVTDRTITNTSHLNTSSQVLIDKKKNQKVKQNIRKLFSINEVKNQSNNAEEIEEETLNEEQINRQNQLKQIITNFKRQNIKEDLFDDEQQQHQDNQLYDIQEQDFEASGQFTKYIKNNFMNEDDFDIEDKVSQKFSPFKINKFNNNINQSNMNNKGNHSIDTLDETIVNNKIKMNNNLINRSLEESIEELKEQFHDGFNQDFRQTNNINNNNDYFENSNQISNKQNYKLNNQTYGRNMNTQKSNQNHQNNNEEQYHSTKQFKNSITDIQNNEDQIIQNNVNLTRNHQKSFQILHNKSSQQFEENEKQLLQQSLIKSQISIKSQQLNQQQFEDDIIQQEILNMQNTSPFYDKLSQDQKEKSENEIFLKRDPQVYSQIDYSLPTQNQFQETQIIQMESPKQSESKLSERINPHNIQEILQQNDDSLQGQIQKNSLQDEIPNDQNNEEQVLSENDAEEIKDKINPDDIKQKKNILFSDKSESSIEEMMEDTPSNYNIPNGRLDEESKGLRSILYKSIMKKYMYDQMQDIKKTDANREDQEAQNITKQNIQKLRSSLEKQRKLSNQNEHKFVKEIVQQQEENLAQQISGVIPNLVPQLNRKGSQGDIEQLNQSSLQKEQEQLKILQKHRHKTPLRL